MDRARVAVEIESLAEFDQRVASGSRRMHGWWVQGVDLTGRADRLHAMDPSGAVFLGCDLTEESTQHLRSRGALLFPRIPEMPIDAYRTTLYTADELYDGLEAGYEHTLDARVYAWTRRRPALVDRLAQALHDHAVDDALEEFVAGRQLVGIMGGHAVGRDSAAYAKASRLGRALTRAGLTVATGGGPGAMEAANLGAYLAPYADDVLEAALALVGPYPSYLGPAVGAWLDSALEVRRRWPDGAESLGVPTWFYGHEPPNALATHVAKYFKNAVREDILLQICHAGIAFLPGAAGTVQEVFQDACENYYAEASLVAPMVLVGREHWTRDLPAWPLLAALGTGRRMGDRIHLVDSTEEAATLLTPG